MSEKAENVQRKTQKAWRTIDQDHFKDYRKVWLFETNRKDHQD